MHQLKKSTRLYGDISKSEEQDDGTVKVWGYASSAAVDSDGESITAEAMKAALPDYMRFANVREMHTSKAAGIAIEAEVQPDGRTFFGAHIIDTEAVKKVRAGVYKGFSIGGKVLSRDAVDKSIINGLRLSEVSLVDRPANPEAVFNFFKAEGLDEGIQQISITDAEFEEFNLLKKEKRERQKAEVIKGMSHVAQLACILKDLKFLVQDQFGETQREGDGSQIATNLSDVLAQMGAILITMTQEEVSELVCCLDPVNNNSGDVVMAGDTHVELTKAGAKFSGASKKALGDAHLAMRAACDHLDGLGYSSKADSDNDIAKVALLDDLKKVTAQRDELITKVTALEALPAATNSVLKVVSKSEDHDQAAQENDAQPKTVEEIMKSIHSGGAMLMSVGNYRALK